MDIIDWEKWGSELQQVFKQATEVFSEECTSDIVVLASDCHPWDGILHLCALTEDEVSEDPELDDPSEMAAWAHFQFTIDYPFWPAELLEEMKNCYNSSSS